MPSEIAESVLVKQDALCFQALQLFFGPFQIASVADRALGVNDAMPGDGLMLRVKFGGQGRQRPAYLPRQSRRAQHATDVAVGSHIARRHLADRGEDPLMERLAAILWVDEVHGSVGGGWQGHSMVCTTGCSLDCRRLDGRSARLCLVAAGGPVS